MMPDDKNCRKRHVLIERKSQMEHTIMTIATVRR